MPFSLGDGKPRSSRKFQQLLQRKINSLPESSQSAAFTKLQNAILSQFLTDEEMVKGGAAMSLRMDVLHVRKSRDFDMTVKDIETFEQSMADRLAEGWEGFTGSIEPQRRKKGPNPLTGMRPYTIRLMYLGQPFCTFDVEASPDLSGFMRNAMKDADQETLALLKELGFHPTTPLLISPADQLADKLHAVSKPVDPDNPPRARDLADIALLAKIDVPPLDELRENVRLIERTQKSVPHAATMLDAGRKPEFREVFDEGKISMPFDECWDTTQELLKQVDVNHRNEWRAYWDRLSALRHPVMPLLEEEAEELARLEGRAAPVSAGRQGHRPRGAAGAGQWDFKR